MSPPTIRQTCELEQAPRSPECTWKEYICLEIRNDGLINGKYNIICYLGHTITPLWPGPVNRRIVVVWHQIKEEEWP